MTAHRLELICSQTDKSVTQVFIPQLLLCVYFGNLNDVYTHKDFNFYSILLTYSVLYEFLKFSDFPLKKLMLFRVVMKTLVKRMLTASTASTVDVLGRPLSCRKAQSGQRQTVENLSLVDINHYFSKHDLCMKVTNMQTQVTAIYFINYQIQSFTSFYMIPQIILFKI